MATLGHRFRSTGNRIGVWLYRALGGRFLSRGTEARVLLLTVPGRRTGVARSTCVNALEVPEGYVVWGSGSGAPRDPDWFRNLRSAPLADVQVGHRHLRMRPRELHGGERDAVWTSVVLARAPAVERYARKAGRTIPVAVLVPAEPADPAEPD